MNYLISVLMLAKFVNSHSVIEQIIFSLSSECNLNRRKRHCFNAETDVQFLLYTNQNPTVAQIFGVTDSLNGSNFNPNVPTRFTVHGWRGTINSEVNRAVIAAALSVGHFNFIAVDWSAAASTLNYPDARDRIVDIARVISQFIDRFVGEGLINLSTLALIGHSLGAHICGLVGKNLKSGKLPFIIGLDPAGPLFDDKKPDERLDSGDANFVEVIHTAGGSLGIMDPIGDANFYPNGGHSQPGCGLDLFGTCAHERSEDLYAESLKDGAEFWATQCLGFHEIKRMCTPSGPGVRMGGEPPNRDNAKGIYYLTTGSSPPFAL